MIFVLVVVVPVLILWSLAKAARLKGPPTQPESKRPVGELVTKAIPEDHPEEDADADSGPEPTAPARSG